MQAKRISWQYCIIASLLFIGAISCSPLHLCAQSNSPARAGVMPDSQFYALVFKHILYLHK